MAIDTKDFEHFDAIDNLHITITVKDFKNMVLHAQTLNATVTAMYSQPSRPLQFSYSSPGMRCEFTLMTVGGDARVNANSATSRAMSRETSSRVQSIAPSHTTRSSHTEMPPPQRPATRSAAPNQAHRLGNRTMSSEQTATSDKDPESLFLPQDDDQQWDPMAEQDDNAGEDMLGWDASVDHVGFISHSFNCTRLVADYVGFSNKDTFHATFQNSTSTSDVPKLNRMTSDREVFIAPTQRASQVSYAKYP